MDESRELAKFVAKLKYSDLPKTVVQKTKDLILDQLGVQLAATDKPWSKAVYKDAIDTGGREDSTIVYYGDKVPVTSAAFVNSTFGHGIELDDGYRASITHPGCVIVPAALALGQRESISGKEAILAVVAGYEIMGRAGAATAPSLFERGHHPTSAAGPFGAAAVGAKILGFDSELTLNALGVAGSSACGLSEFNQTGGMSKRIHGGLGSSGGLRAALLAKKGLTGPPTILEGAKGFLRTFSGEKKDHLLTKDLGKSWVVLDTNYKRHANCAMNHGPIDSLLKIMAKHPIKHDDVEELVILHNSRAKQIIGVITDPQSITEAQFSGYFSLAMTVVMGSNSLGNYTEETLVNEDIRKLSRKVRFEVDPEAEASYPQKRMGGIAVKLKDGTSYQEKTEYAKGMPENPFTAEELRDKFRDLSTVVLPEQKVESIIEAVDSLEDLDDVNMLASKLRR